MKPLKGWCPFGLFFLRWLGFGIAAWGSLIGCLCSWPVEVWRFPALLSKVSCLELVVDSVMLDYMKLFGSFIEILEFVKVWSQRPVPTIQHHHENCFHILCWRQQYALRNLVVLIQFFWGWLLEFITTSEAILVLSSASNMDSGTYQHHSERFHNLSADCSTPKFTAIIDMVLTPVQPKPNFDTPIIILPGFSHVHSAAALILCIRSSSAPQLWP